MHHACTARFVSKPHCISVNDSGALCLRIDRDLPTSAPTSILHLRIGQRRRHIGAVRQFTEASPHTVYKVRLDELLNKPPCTAVTPKSMPTLRQTWPRLETSAARCVRDVDDQGVLQFTLLHAVCCALHRRTSRVIHRLELFLYSRVSLSICNQQEDSIRSEKSEAASLMMGT